MSLIKPTVYRISYVNDEGRWWLGEKSWCDCWQDAQEFQDFYAARLIADAKQSQVQSKVRVVPFVS